MGSTDIGIDLGTASVLVYVKGKGVVLKEPSVVAFEKETNKLIAIGEEARLMIGRTPGEIDAIRPLRQGVISDYTVTEQMLKYFIQKALDYIRNNLNKPVKGKFLLLLIAIIIEHYKDPKAVEIAYSNLELLTADGKADMSNMTEAAADKYFSWLLPNVCRISREKASMERAYKLFDMPDNISELFFVCCTNVYLKQCKDEKSYDVFCEFLGFAFENGNERIQEKIGKILHKLHKQKFSDLSKEVMNYYRKDNDILLYWNKIKGIAESTNPILNNITHLLKRKK